MASLFALAPDGVCQAAASPRRWCALTTPFQLFSVRTRGVFFSVTLSVGSPRPAVSRHPTLRSPDFPHHPRPSTRRSRCRDRPAHFCALDYSEREVAMPFWNAWVSRQGDAPRSGGPRGRVEKMDEGRGAILERLGFEAEKWHPVLRPLPSVKHPGSLNQGARTSCDGSSRRVRR